MLPHGVGAWGGFFSVKVTSATVELHTKVTQSEGELACAANVLRKMNVIHTYTVMRSRGPSEMQTRAMKSVSW